ncbi:hypothetical protein K2173_003058 [Erythroxylum novogranatense]|uniref:non-specific serine/threonine protein kinase n=1 Tax=Erythroxylum novogranatense TaxID=1862640 RepID=A0AAV8S8A1_9ROSI|nr:hypothetical protein K2173_003058 [Erythroxylum novogranatense]
MSFKEMEKKTDVSSPVGVLEEFFRSEDSENWSSKEPTSDIDTQKDPKPASLWRGFVQLLRSKSKKSVATSHPLNAFKLSVRRSRSMREAFGMIPNLFLNTNGDSLKAPRKSFTLPELESATNNFSQGNLIGKGGYAEVYRGYLQSGKLVAVKRLTRGTTDEKVGDFLSEVGIMAHVTHRNTIKLIGYGIDGGMHIVLEYLPRGSLASLLYGSKETLNWSIRYKIALGTAQGLLYLHEGCQRRIIHRDIKAANILLTEDFEPKICDFGLAKWLPEHWTHHTVSKFEGTFGYLAPEYLMHGIVDQKTDVFAFGVLLLELVTGRRALDYSQQSLVLWAKPLLKKNEIMELVDPTLAKDYDARQLNLVLLTASLCIQRSSIRRPQMSQVTEILNGNLSSLKTVKKSKISFFRKALEEDILFAGQYKSLKKN